MKIMGSILSFTWQIFKYFFVPIVFIVGLVAILLMVYFLIFSFKGNRLPKGEHRVVKRSDFLRNLFTISLCGISRTFSIVILNTSDIRAALSILAVRVTVKHCNG